MWPLLLFHNRQEPAVALGFLRHDIALCVYLDLPSSWFLFGFDMMCGVMNVVSVLISLALGFSWL
jgi:hypothetical protein